MASSTSSDIAKAGWLYRQSSILHRWKRNWFILDRQGNLRYFESPDSPKAEERIVVRVGVTSIRAGVDCRRHDPPDGLSIVRCGFLELLMRDGATMVLCADTSDEMKAWQIALEEARTLPMPNIPMHYAPAPGFVQYVSPYGGYPTFHSYPGQVLSTPATQQVIHTPTGTTTIMAAPPQQQVIIVDDDPYRYRHRYGRARGPVFWW